MPCHHYEQGTLQMVARQSSAGRVKSVRDGGEHAFPVCVSHGSPEVSVDEGCGWEQQGLVSHKAQPSLGLHATIDLRGLAAVARGSELAAPGLGTTYPGSMWPSPSARYHLSPPWPRAFQLTHHELASDWINHTMAKYIYLQVVCFGLHQSPLVLAAKHPYGSRITIVTSSCVNSPFIIHA